MALPWLTMTKSGLFRLSALFCTGLLLLSSVCFAKTPDSSQETGTAFTFALPAETGKEPVPDTGDTDAGFFPPCLFLVLSGGFLTVHLCRRQQAQ